MGIEIQFLDYTRAHFHGSKAQAVINDLKTQIRSRSEWVDRSELWEAYEPAQSIYTNAPHLDGRVYSFDKQMAILRSRMTRQEKEELNG